MSVMQACVLHAFILFCAQVLSPFFIIFRVAQGKAWSGSDISTYTTDVSGRSGADNSVSVPMSVRVTKSHATDSGRDVESDLVMNFNKRRSDPDPGRDSEWNP